MTVKWLVPSWKGNAVVWDLHCSAVKVTLGQEGPCGSRAKVMFDGKPLCVPHAKGLALERLAGPPPKLTIGPAE